MKTKTSMPKRVEIRKRVPSVLVPVLNRKEIKRIFQSQMEVDKFNALLDECSAIINSGLPLEVTAPIVLDKGLQQYRKHSKRTMQKALDIDSIIALYLAHSKENVTEVEYKNRVDFFTKLLPALFKFYRLDVLSLKAADMEILSKAIFNLPNRKYAKFKRLSADRLLQLNVGKEEKIHIDTANKMVKRIRSLALYGESTGLYKMPRKINTHKASHQDKNFREPFTEEEILTLYIELTEKQRLILDIVYYSGMRTSEICKSTINTVDGVLCFDLKNSKEALKTHSSYRCIPIHSKLLPHLDEIKALSYSTVKARARKIHINNKTLYSARHSFVTALINKGVPPERVSELVGHAHKTMTMGTYFAGYSIDQLKTDVELL